MSENVLTILNDGRALTARELARATRREVMTIEGQLAELLDVSLIVRHRQGPHSYYRIATPPEPGVAAPLKAWKGGEALRHARTCYGHFAGLFGLAITDALVAREYVVLSPNEASITPAGIRFLEDFGVDLGRSGKAAKPICRPCLDWSERRPHLTGLAATRIADRCFNLGWTARIAGTRAIAITPEGRRGFTDIWGFAASGR